MKQLKKIFNFIKGLFERFDKELDEFYKKPKDMTEEEWAEYQRTTMIYNDTWWDKF